MSVSIAPQTASRSTASRRPWTTFLRSAWLRHRAAFAGLIVLGGVLAIAIIWQGRAFMPAYDRYAAAGCLTGHPSAVCVRLDNQFLTVRAAYMRSYTTLLLALQVALPLTVGALVGAPLLARDFESGAFRFAWTQGVGRRRLVLSTLVALASVLATIGVVLGLLFAGWYAHALGAVLGGPVTRWSSGPFNVTALTLPCWMLFGLALGTLLGAAIKRTVAAISATFVLLSGALLAGWALVPRLLAVGANVSSHRLAILGLPLPGASNTSSVGPGSSLWVLHQWMTGPDGHVMSTNAAQAMTQKFFATERSTYFNPAAAARWLSARHLTLWTSYQTPGRFWVYQGAEGAILILGALLLTALCLRIIRSGSY